ncbi:hypothetical protein AB6D11_06405 [Vibrio splendidus]
MSSQTLKGRSAVEILRTEAKAAPKITHEDGKTHLSMSLQLAETSPEVRSFFKHAFSTRPWRTFAMNVDGDLLNNFTISNTYPFDLSSDDGEELLSEAKKGFTSMITSCLYNTIREFENVAKAEAVNEAIDKPILPEPNFS